MTETMAEDWSPRDRPDFPTVDFNSWFYKNCKTQRKRKAKICQECPFRVGIESQEDERDKI